MDKNTATAKTLTAAMREAGCPMHAVAATPRFFLAQRYGQKFLGLPIATQRAIQDAVQRELGAPVGDQGPSIAGQRYA